MRATLALALLLVAAAPAAALRVVVISDLNGAYGSTDYGKAAHAAVARIIALEPDLVISTGDMVAGQRRPHLAEGELRAMWRAFHAAVSDPLGDAGIPLLVTPGNHDASAYSGFELEREVYRDEWANRLPDVAIEGDWPFRYSATLGGVRFVSLDVTTVGALDPPQMTWLEAQGQSEADTVIFSHLPLHPFSNERRTEIIGDPELGHLLRELSFDVYLSGHHHAYWPGSARGVAYVSQACLGGGPRALIGDDTRAPRAITVLDIATDGVGVSALSGADFRTRIELTELPPRIGVLDRLDLAPTERVFVAP
jgi:3',5'-cyclic AMP phosphodiesterase CpdA